MGRNAAKLLKIRMPTARSRPAKPESGNEAVARARREGLDTAHAACEALSKASLNR